VRLEAEYSDCLRAVRAAQEEADALLPQCLIVRRRWRSGTVEDFAKAVVLRKTAGGQLVVRRVGDADGTEYRFKWAERAQVYRQAEKSTSWASDTRELRDVPPEFAALPHKGAA